MSEERKVFIGIVALVLLVIGVSAFVYQSEDNKEDEPVYTMADVATTTTEAELSKYEKMAIVQTQLPSILAQEIGVSRVGAVSIGDWSINESNFVRVKGTCYSYDSYGQMKNKYTFSVGMIFNEVRPLVSFVNCDKKY